MSFHSFRNRCFPASKKNINDLYEKIVKKIELLNSNNFINKKDFNLYEDLHINRNIIPTYIPTVYIKNYFEDLDAVWKNYIKNKTENIGEQTRFFQFVLNMKLLEKENIEGDFAELGVHNGNTASILSYFGNIFHRKVYLFDTFEGFHPSNLVGIDENKEKGAFSGVNIQNVIDKLDMETCHIIKGLFPNSITDECKNTKYAFVHLDCDLYEPTKYGLEFFWERLNIGGFIFIHDYFAQVWDGCTKAVDEFIYKNNIHSLVIMPDRSSTAVLRKTS